LRHSGLDSSRSSACRTSSTLLHDQHDGDIARPQIEEQPKSTHDLDGDESDQKNVGIGNPIAARAVHDCRKAKIFPEPDATKKNAIK
jgi:hypothetical protein